jgi:predicted nucleotidyltransferase
MKHQNKLDELLTKFYCEMKRIFDDKLVDIILFGSFVEGNQDEESDIDVMVLIDKDERQIHEHFKEVINIVSDIDLEYNVVLSPVLQCYAEYEEYRTVLPFFKNVSKGVKISA